VVDSTEFGGAERHVLSLAQGLFALGVRFRVITRESVLAEQLRQNGIETTVAPFDDLMRTVGIVRRTCSEQADIVHAHRWGAILAAATALRGTETPLVCTVHSMFAPEARFSGRTENAERLPQVIAREARQVVAISQAVKETLVRHGVPEERVKVIYTGVRALPTVPPDLTGIPAIGFVGRLSFEKGPDLLLKAAALLRQRAPSLRFNVHFIGDGQMRSYLEEQARLLGLDGCCRFFGFLRDPGPEAARLTLLAVPSRQEGMGLVIPEAMSAGIPVVGAAVGGIPEAVANGETGLLVPPENPGALAQALERLLIDAEQRRCYGERSRQVWAERFDLHRFTQDHLHLYRSLLAR